MINTNMDRAISDSQISSCQELEEMREQAERAALEAVERRMNDIVRQAMEEDEEIVAEKNILEQELANELRSMATFRELLTTSQDAARHQLHEMLELQTQLTNMNLNTVHLLSTLQDVREQNRATLQSDPIYALIEEERHLQQQLQDAGIFVYPPTDSDEYYQ